MMVKLLIINLTLSFLSLTLLAQTGQVTIVLNDTSLLVMEKVRFDTTEKSFQFHDGKYVTAINGRPAFGIDGDYPRSVLNKATLVIGHQKIDLQIEDMYNPWFGGVNEELFTLEADGNEVRLKGLFSDAAGSYGAEWLIVGEASIRTILTKREKILIEYFHD